MQPPGKIKFEHQGGFCLTINYPRCEIFINRSKIIPSPGKPIQAENAGKRKISFHNKWKWGIGLTILGLVIIGLTIHSPNRQNFIISPTSFLPVTPKTNLQSALTTPIPTLPSPSVDSTTKTPETPFPPTPILHELEIPIGPYGLIIHQVLEGENLISISERYGTSQEAIQAINFNLPPSIWIGWYLVIPGFQTDVTTFPKFEAFQATNTIQLSDLANQFGVNLELLKYCNGLETSSMITSGEWVLIPH